MGLLDPKSSNCVASVKHEPVVSTLLEAVLSRQRYFLKFLTLQAVIVDNHKIIFPEKKSSFLLKPVLILSSSSLSLRPPIVLVSPLL